MEEQRRGVVETTAFFGQQPIKVVDDVINCFGDSARRLASSPSSACADCADCLHVAVLCDSADAIERILISHPELASKSTEIKQASFAPAAMEHDGQGSQSCPPPLCAFPPQPP